MKSFKQFISEVQLHVPIVPVEVTKFDLEDDSTINELNKNLAVTMSVGFGNIDEAFNKVRKVLSMYNIQVPQTTFDDDMEGSVEIPLDQSDESGESHYDVTGPFQEKTKKHKLKFSYELKDGYYDANAEVVKL